MAPTEDDAVGVDHDVPLSEIALEPDTVDVPEVVDPYTAPLPFPHAAPGPAEHETLAGMAQICFLALKMWIWLCQH